MAFLKSYGGRFTLVVNSFLHLLLAAQVNAQQCSGTVPCSQGCCSTSGYCGFGSAYCGSGNCTNNCDAVAECGQYAAQGHELCPLNVCCSQWGFCGTTSDFCETGCQQGCQAVVRPSCAATGRASSGVRIGYFESWSTTRACDAWQPEYINSQLWTHIYFSFAVIGPDNQIAAMNPYDPELYPRVTGLKQQNRGLKVYISVGGWDAGGPMFSQMVATESSRATFIQSAIRFMDSYGFDGLDMDWEYPAAPDRGGVGADTANYVQFLREMRAATLGRYGLTATLPSSYWYMQGFDVSGMEQYLDWFNFMSYDIHGTWDGQSQYTSAIVQPHTNLTEIAQGLDLLWRNHISPSKVVLGLAFYGRSFTLADPSCDTVDCPFLSGGEPGPCTGTAGILSDKEIAEIIAENHLTPTEDIEAGVKWITWGGNQWVSYDDADTFQLKMQFADELCLGGVMVWALDLDDAATQTSSYALYGSSLSDLQAQAGGPPLSDQVIKNALDTGYKQTLIGLMVFWTDCMVTPSCPIGFTKLAVAVGQVFDFDSSTIRGDACVGGGFGNARALCIESDAEVSYDCGWQNWPSGCQGTCSDEYFLVTQNSWPSGSKSSCYPGSYSSFCCTNIHAAYYNLVSCASTTVNQLLSGGLGPTVANASEIAARGMPVLDYFSTFQECAWANGGGLPGTGIIPVQVPGYWEEQVGAGGVVNNYAFNPINYNVVKPQQPQAIAGCYATITVTQPDTTSYVTPVTRVCDGLRWTQACYHASSVASRFPQANPITCSRIKAPNRSLPRTWNSQHNSQWREWILSLPSARGENECQRDEYPPAVMANSGTQWIRFIPAKDNGGSGSYLFARVCPDYASVESTTITGQVPDQNYVCTDSVYTTVTITCLSLEFANLPWPDDGLDYNECQPQYVTYDPGFALLRNDEWYQENAGHNPYAYAYPIPQANLNGAGLGTPKNPSGTNDDDGPIIEKRRARAQRESQDISSHPVRFLVVPGDVEDGEAFLESNGGGLPLDFDPDTLTVEDELTGQWRKATDEELWDMYGLLRCLSEDCEDERDQILLRDYEDTARRMTPRKAPVPSPTAAGLHSVPTENGGSIGSSHQALTDGLPQATPRPMRA